MAIILGNIKIEPVYATWNAIDLGSLDGNVGVSFEEQSTDVLAHEKGTSVLTSIRTGRSFEITITLKETTVAQLKTIFGPTTTLVTPGGGTEVIGWGDDLNFASQISDSQKLIFHPVTLAGADESRDLSFWKAYPMPENFEFSGEDLFMVPVSFKIFPDLTKPLNVQWAVYGDSTQTFT